MNENLEDTFATGYLANKDKPKPEGSMTRPYLTGKKWHMELFKPYIYPATTEELPKKVTIICLI